MVASVTVCAIVLGAKVEAALLIGIAALAILIVFCVALTFIGDSK